MPTPGAQLRRADSTETRASAGTAVANRRTVLLGGLAILLITALSWWVERTVEHGIARQLQGDLQAIRDAEVAAFQIWAKAQLRLAETIAEDERAVTAIRELGRLRRDDDLTRRLLESPQQQSVRAGLGLVVRGLGYLGFSLTGADGTILVASRDADVGQGLELPLMGSERAWITPPVRLRIPGTDAPLRMLVSAPVKGEGGKVLGAIHLHLDPNGTFSRIFQAGRPGESGETYAFDRHGHLLSDSRFKDELKRAGLLGAKAESAIWEVEIRDPGGDLTQGHRPEVPRQSQPLTHMVAEAIARGNGVDVVGYRDYRGVPVVGAWTWLDEYGLGLATELDVSEAYALRKPLGWAFVALLGVAALALVGVVFAAHVVERLNRRARAAERKAMKLGHYTLGRKLGEGGMGAVYEGHHRMLRRPTAIKLMLQPTDSGATERNAADIARFEREVQATSQLSHPNTIAVYDYGKTAEGIFYYAMEFLKGINLYDLVRENGPLPPGRVIHLMLQATGSLAEAHEANMVHRDIKPANMMVCHRGGVPDLLKVLDFGLVSAKTEGGSRLTAVGSLMGTPAYLAPEAIKSATKASARSDIYALGGTMYFLLAGRDVFEKKTISEMCTAHLTETPEPPSKRTELPIPRDLETLVMQCLAKDATERPQTMRAVAQALRKCAACGSWTIEDAEAWWAKTGNSLAPTPSERPEPPSIAPRAGASLEIFD
jgi:hypothetical protein